MEVLIFSKRKALYDLSKKIRSSDICYYLSDDYLTLVEIKKKLDNKYNILTLGTRFHKAIEEIEKDFLSFCHKINFANQSEAYWGTQIASRNSASIPLLKYLVYFHCAKELLSHVSSLIILICDSPALAKVIEKEVKDQGFSCQVKFLLSEFMSSLKVYCKVFLKGVYFLTSSVMQWCYARLLKNKRIDNQSHAERYILRSWVTTGTLDKEGQYKDRNFGVLPEYLGQQGKDVWILPMFFNLDKSIFTQMKLMSQSTYNYIFPEQYISILDLLRTIRDGIKTISLDLDGTEFEGQDLSPVVKEIHLKSCLSPQLMSLNSARYLIEKFAQKRVRIDRFIYPIENNAPEKPFILAARRYYPDSRIVGFQHSVWFKEQLGMYLHPEELSYHPLPDQIICSGPRYLDILQKCGFPRNILSAGPNLRYTMANQDFKSNCDNLLHDERTILIILNYDINQSIELLKKAGRALEGIQGSRVHLKAHPTISVEDMEIFLKGIRFPAFEWVAGSVQELTLKSDAVLMTGGSVSNIETIATGVPLLRVSLGSNFDFDCLWDEYPFTPFLCSEEEIHQYLVKALALNPAERENLIVFGQGIAADYFEAVTSENLRGFLL